jgi:hypothetical protein
VYTLHIRQFETSYRLPRSRMYERERLDGLVPTLLGDALERALERAGISPHEEICIRRISVPLRLRMNLADSALVARWSVALVEAIQRGAAEAVRYTSRVQALVDMAQSSNRGDLSRAWAWRQLGIWRAGDYAAAAIAAREVARALIAAPEMVVAVLAAVNPWTFAGLLRHLEVAQWRELAGTACAVTGIAPAGPGGRQHLAATKERARLAVRRSSIAAAAAGLPAVKCELARAIAVIAIVEADAALLSASSEAVEEAARELEQARTAAVPAPAPSDELPALRRRAFTQFGGLLFLLRLIEEINVHEELAEACPEHPIRSLLHRLAVTLMPMDAADPAALAFCGLLPDAEPPCLELLDDAPIRAAASRVESVLAERLDHTYSLGWLVRRRAEIVADPGWIEAHFSLDDVSLDLRRRGLDFDPGWLPWLGVVMRFVYA